jgi:hypothetical protein
MSLKQILKKFDRFDYKTDCLVMVGKDDRFSFYAPDQYTKKVEGGDIPPHIFIAMMFAYLAAHGDDHPEMIKALRDKVMTWIHEA